MSKEKFNEDDNIDNEKNSVQSDEIDYEINEENNDTQDSDDYSEEESSEKGISKKSENHHEKHAEKQHEHSHKTQNHKSHKHESEDKHKEKHAEKHIEKESTDSRHKEHVEHEHKNNSNNSKGDSDSSDKEDDAYSFTFDSQDEFYSIKPKTFLIGLLIVIVAGLLVFGGFYIGKKFKENREARDLAEQSRPSKLQLTIITDKQCTSCFDISSVVLDLKDTLNVTKETNLDYSSSDSKALINKYQIKKIPAIIAEGEINRTGSIEGFEEIDGILLYTGTQPPYTDAITGDVLGEISAVIIYNPGCTDCVNLTNALEELKTMARVVSEKLVSSSSSEGQELIMRHQIKKLPTMILSKDVKAYDFAQALEGVGTYDDYGNYVLRNVSPPYYDLAQARVVGMIDITFLKDKDCSGCYNVSEHRQILESMGVKIRTETTAFIGEDNGDELKTLYNITAIPTIIISKEAMAYPAFAGVWDSVGTKESDGSLIFRQVEQMGVYKDLTTNKIVNLTQPTS